MLKACLLILSLYMMPALSLAQENNTDTPDTASLQKDLETLEQQMFPQQTTPLAFSNVIVPFEGFLVTAIPKYNLKLFDASQIISVSMKRGQQDWVYYYHINPDAPELIAALKANNYKITVYSGLAKEAINPLMKAFKLPKEKSTLADVATLKIVDLSKPLDISSFSESKKSIMIANDGIPSKASDQIISTGAVYYAYPSYEDMMKNKALVGGDSGFAPSRDAWELDWLKVGSVYYMLDEANHGDKQAYLKSLKAVFKDNLLRVARIGTKMLDGSYHRLSYTWDVKDGKVTGCGIQDARTEKSVKDVDLSICLRTQTVIPSFKIDKATARATGCELKTAGGASIQDADSINPCLDAKKKTFKYAIEYVSKKCAAFTSDMYYINEADGANCDSQQYAYFYPKANKFISFKAFKGMEKMTDKQLLAALTDGPTAKDPFRLYQSWDPFALVGLRLKECTSDDDWQTMKEDSRGNLLQKCQPDTLYSWGTIEKLNILKSQIGAQRKWSDIRALYTSRGPITTFGYGPIPIRIKLKKNVHFVKSSYKTCDGTPDEKNSVYYRHDGSFSDWTICNQEVIASWSDSSPQMYDEIVKDYLQYRRLKAAGLPQETNMEVYSHYHQGTDIFFGGNIDGRYPFDYPTFVQFLADIRKQIAAGKSEVFYNPNLPAAEKNEDAHFHTDHPIYFNDR